MPFYVIRKIRLAHCKRGPERCAACREMDSGKLCLLDICPPDPGMLQRRVIEITRGRESSWHEFDVIQIFQNRQEAEEYANLHQIEDVEWN